MKLILLASIFIMGCFTNPKKEHSTEFKVRVIKIVDGDTYDILLDNNITRRIRMEGIDAPERKMPFYQVAKDYLGKLCYGQIVRIKHTDTDRNGRWVATTFVADGSELGLLMIKAGYAWHFKKYSADKELARAELSARTNRVGLWADPFPIAPWEWRIKPKKKNP